MQAELIQFIECIRSHISYNYSPLAARPASIYRHPYLMTYRITSLYSYDKFESCDSLMAAKKLLLECLGNKSNILMLSVFAPVKTK